jgi:EAL domain-containing protein (putative c-di-GMP-specific phosphodiesterase class I)
MIEDGAMRNEHEVTDVAARKEHAPRIATFAPRTSRAMWFLAGRLSVDGPLCYVPIDCNPFLVGRQPEASLCLASRVVSSMHAELTDTGINLVLRDTGSTNGTFVNGQRVSAPTVLNPDDLIHFADIPFRVMSQHVQHCAATAPEDVLDRAMVLVLFDKLMNEQAVVPHYQPIVNLEDDDKVVAFEVLVRSQYSTLQTPMAMFSAAAQLGLEVELSQMIRFKAVQETLSLKNPPHLFLNTHPAELEKPGLIDSMKSLRALRQSQRITLEIHEKAITDCGSMKRLREELRELDVGIAFDDFGAGQARLVDLVDVHPEYLKFDMSLTRDIHLASAERQGLVSSLVRMARDLGTIPLAEGIECEKERDACVVLGFELAQGFHFGRPTALTANASRPTATIGWHEFAKDREHSP